ncbi:DUF2784 domain-containing protein [Pseudomonas sp. NA-150]|uniref:DUF2784 domain-containing protein n=1 Tax=Pseudomonas sp. NA-150 TaxID=3367525 RepID=UPI0037C65FFB
MLYRVFADAVVVFHLVFIVFVMLGGLLVLRWHWLLALHLPAMVWGAVVEFFHLYCPLTPLENSLRVQGGEQAYAGDFIQHSLIPLIYPAGLTPGIQLWLGAAVVFTNVLVYGCLIRHAWIHRKAL